MNPQNFRARQIFQGIAWNHAGKLLEYVLLYAISVLIARGLGVAENGKYAGLLSLAQLLMVLSSLGLEVSLNKHIPQLGESDREPQARFVLKRAMLVRLGLFLPALLFTIGLTAVLPSHFTGLAKSYFVILVAYAGLRASVSLLVVVLTSQLKTALPASVAVATRLFELIGVILIGAVGLTIERLLFLFVVSNSCQLLFTAVVARSNVFGIEKAVPFKPILAFGAVFWVNILVEYVLAKQGDVLLLNSLIIDSSQASLYDVAYGVAQLASLAMTVGLGGITLATFARLAISVSPLLDRFYAFAVRVISLLTIPLYSYLLFNGKFIVGLLYSSEYYAAMPLLQGMLAFRIVSRLFGGPENAEYLLATDRVKSLVTVGVVAALVNILLDILLIPHFGAMGAVVGSGLANLLVNVLGAILVLRVANARIQVLSWAKLVTLTCSISVAVFWLIESLTPATFILNLTVFGTVSLSALIWLKPFTAADGTWFDHIGKRVSVLSTPFVRREPATTPGRGA